jgi:hypothetical protein
MESKLSGVLEWVVYPVTDVIVSDVANRLICSCFYPPKALIKRTNIPCTADRAVVSSKMLLAAASFGEDAQ